MRRSEQQDCLSEGNYASQICWNYFKVLKNHEQVIHVDLVYLDFQKLSRDLL